MKRKADGALIAGPGTASDTQARFMDSGARPSDVVDPATKVKFMGQQGRCVVAKDHVEAEAIVMEYSGEIIRAKEVPKRRKLYASQKVSEPFFLHFSPGYVIDATHKGNTSRFMTHSVSPNCQLQTWYIGADPKVYVLAVKDIAPGAELTYTVYQNCSLGQNVRCMCGAARCADSSASESPSPGTLQRSRQENEQMADAVIKCLQAEKLRPYTQMPAQNAQTSRAALPLHARIPACPDASHLVNSPSHGARESINALGLDSPDSFLDHLHTGNVQRHAQLPVQTSSVQRHAQPPVQTLNDIASRCAKLAQQLNETPSEPPRANTTQAMTAQPAAPRGTKQSPIQNAAMPVASAPASAQQLSRQLLSKLPLPQRTHGADLSRFAPSQAQPMMLGPGKQAGQQLQEHLIQYQGVLMSGYTMAAKTRALEAAVPPYQRMLSLKTVLSQRLQTGGPTDPTSLLGEAGWKPCLQQSKKASLQPDTAGAGGMLSIEMNQNVKAHSQQATDAALRRVCDTPDAFCAIVGGLPTLETQSCPEQNEQIPPHSVLSSTPPFVAPAGPQMLAVQTSVPVASTLPIDEHLLSCSEHLVPSLRSQFPCSLEVPPEVHPYFQVNVPPHTSH